MGAIAGAAASRLSTHLHFIVEADGYDRLTTHIFDPDDRYISSDTVFGVKESLLARFQLVDNPERAAQLGVANPFYDVEFDFALAKARPPGREP